MINIRDISKQEAKKEIKEYMEIHDRAYVSKIAEELELELELAFSLVEELEKEKEVEATGN